MAIHNAAFFGAAAFLLGVATASVGIAFGVYAATLGAAAFGLVAVKKSFSVGLSRLAVAGLAGAAMTGFLYFHLSAVLKEPYLPAGAPLEAVIAREPKRGDRQELTLSLRAPAKGSVVWYAPRYPAYAYGDVLRFGSESSLSVRYGRYVLRGDATRTAEGEGSRLRSALYAAKRAFVGTLEATLPREKAALLAGLTVGERGEFSDEFKEALRVSGTTHIVALSGYNIAVVALAAGALFLKFLPRRLGFLATLGLIAAFVIATGAEASVVRAGIMGAILLLAKDSGRMYNLRNAIALTAFVMVAADPSVLIFDLGFQLSFLALLGIVFLMPAIASFVARVRGVPAILKEHFATTAAAQLAVMPLLLASFGSVSLFSLPANVLVLFTVPVTMALGFLTGFAGLVSATLAEFFAIPAGVLLSYQIGAIEFFSRLPQAGLTLTPSWLIVLPYYALLVFWIRRKPKPSHAP
ncbi:MAG: ComEC/Rec2 family competence protein [Candidatus Liptonbacteria bacterium]|nr:ComEC/Rec2 family competence protein [Candidatus Liptonbacteria bacterium]